MAQDAMRYAYGEVCTRDLHRIDDGKVEQMIDFEIKRVVQDMADRPHDDRERKVTVELRFKPVSGPAGLEKVAFAVEATSKVPKSSTETYQATMDRTGKPRFATFSPLDAEARDIREMTEAVFEDHGDEEQES